GLFRALERGEQVVDRLVAHALQREPLLAGQRVEIGGRLDQPALDQLRAGLVAETLDVHRPPRGEVAQPAVELRRTGEVGAAGDGAFAVHLRAGGWGARRPLELGQAPRRPRPGAA